jgi:O-antigen/teichoic acid export membrane protein
LAGDIIYLLLESLFFKIFDVKIELVLSFCIILFSIFSNSLSGFFYAEGKFKKYAIVYSVQGFVMVLSCFILGKYFNFIGILLGLLIAYFFTTIYSIFYFRKKRLNFFFSNELIVRAVKKVFFPSIFSGLLFQPAILITAFLINKYASSTEVIAYTIANQFRMVLGILPITLGAVLLKVLVENKKKNIVKIERINYSLSYYPIMILSIVLLFFHDLINLMIDNLDNEVFFLCLLFFISGTVITSFKGAVARKFVSDEKGKISVLSNFSWFVIFLFMAFFFIPDYAAVGAAFSFLIAQILHVLAWSPFYVKYKYYCLEFFDYKFYLSLSIYFMLLACIYFNFLYLVPVLFLIILFLFYQEIKLFKKYF